MNRSLKILLPFLLLLGGALLYAYLNWPRQNTVSDSPPFAAVPRKPVDAGQEAAMAPVEKDADRSGPSARDIFAPLFPAAAKPRLSSTANGRPAQASASASAALAPLTPPPPPRPVFLGMLKHAAVHRVFLSVSGEVFVVRSGERFGPGDHYALLQIDGQNLIVKHDEEAESYRIEALQPPISILSPIGRSTAPATLTRQPAEFSVPAETEDIDKEVPADGIVEK
ncbi:hypothetical protein [Syntrophotalea acetylenica]|uniref:hypothetical protein n=1 Tax=Syntrophotalea acetylenica TaxID=29542 RepID=UPI002A36C657|nr:hypothetical protein [Syntrophotalea acetylenica]MDY0262281.1 hypothetical protein [Syntrophotalea acetylenica]